MTRSFEDYVKTAGAYATPGTESLSLEEPGLLRRAGGYLKAYPWKSGLAAAGLLGAGALAGHLLGFGRKQEVPEELKAMPIGGKQEVPEELKEIPIGEHPNFIGKGIERGVGDIFTEGAKALGHYAHSRLKRRWHERQQRRVFDQVTATDPVLAEADPAMLQQSYATMAHFAPTLASDPYAAQSFLREAVTTGGGINYNTLKLLAEAELATQQV